MIRQPLDVFALLHGGILGLNVAVCIFARNRKIDPWLLPDASSSANPLGIALGRIANFINGELWGRPSLVPWAVILPDARLVNGNERAPPSEPTLCGRH